jgi:hypothetical protein
MHHRFQITTFLHWWRFYYCYYRFLQHRNNSFCHNTLTDFLLPMQKESAPSSTFQSSFQGSTYFSTFLFMWRELVCGSTVRVWPLRSATCSTVRVWPLRSATCSTVRVWPLPSATCTSAITYEPPKNDRNNRKQHQRKTSLVWKCGENEKRCRLHFLLQMMFPVTSVSVVLESQSLTLSIKQTDTHAVVSRIEFTYIPQLLHTEHTIECDYKEVIISWNQNQVISNKRIILG